MGPLLSSNASFGRDLKTLLCVIARDESTQWSLRKIQAMSLGVSFSGNNLLFMLIKANRT